MRKQFLVWVLCLGCAAAAGCKGASKKQPAVDARVLARAAKHFGTDPAGIEVHVLCEAPGGVGRVFSTREKDVRDGDSAIIILDNGVCGPGDGGHGVERAFAACGIKDRLPAEAALAAEVFLSVGGRGGRTESIVEGTGAMEPAGDGANPHAPAVSIIEGGWNLTFWTDDIDTCTYRRFKVFILRSGMVELGSTETHTYPCK